ncbi:MAG: hypothetical protein GEU75_08875 [Dehalococcoidia bacterium]|nr:hypothetical protein [Dehalococcoidia bacterium]
MSSSRPRKASLFTRAWRPGLLVAILIFGLVAASGAAPSVEARKIVQTYDTFLGPATATNLIGANHTLAAQVYVSWENCDPEGDQSGTDPATHVTVQLRVTSGPNQGHTETATTNPQGIAEFTYTSSKTGTDHLVARPLGVVDGHCQGANTAPQPSNEVVANWVAPKLSIDNVTFTEGNTELTPPTHAVFTVSLDQPPAQQVKVEYATAEDTATQGPNNDFVGQLGLLTFDIGDISKTIDIDVVGDLIAEPDETFNVVLSNPQGAQIADDTGVGTIIDDDMVEIEIDDVTVTEGDSGTTPATFTVSLSNASSTTITVGYSTADGSAITPDDYASKATVLEFPPGEISRTITVDVMGDLVDEQDEFFELLLFNPVNAQIADDTGIGTVIDDDVAEISINDVTVTEGNTGLSPATPAVFTVTLSTPSASEITLDYATADGTATAPQDYVATNGTLTFPPLETSQTLTVPVVGDLEDEPDEEFYVELSNANATIADNTGIGTIIDDERDGSFSCRASALRVLSIEPVVANEPDVPCLDEAKSLVDVDVISGLLSASAGVADASTDQTPDDLQEPPAAGDNAVAHADLADVSLAAGLNLIQIQAVSADAKAECAAVGQEPPVLSGSSLVTLSINGEPLLTISEPITIPLLVASLHLNQTVMEQGRITQRTLVLETLLGDIVIGEATVNFEGNPCDS